MNITLESLEEAIQESARLTSPEVERQARPEDIEALAALVQGTLPSEDAGGLEAALTADPVLRELLALSAGGALEELEDRAPTPVPARVLQRVYGLVASPPGLWEISVRTLKQGLELLSHTSELLQARPLAVRGADAAAAGPEDLTFARRLPPYDARFTVQRIEGGMVSLSLSLLQENEHVQGFELELWQGDRLRGVRGDQAGVAVFPYVKPGHHRLLVKTGGQVIGSLELHLAA